MELRVKKLRKDAKLPTRGSAQAAGYDLYACLDGDLTIAPHQTERVPPGLAVAVPDGYFAAVVARSGLAAKEGLRPANCVGVCDSDYRGEYLVMLHNDTDMPRTVRHGAGRWRTWTRRNEGPGALAAPAGERKNGIKKSLGCSQGLFLSDSHSAIFRSITWLSALLQPADTRPQTMTSKTALAVKNMTMMLHRLAPPK